MKLDDLLEELVVDKEGNEKIEQNGKLFAVYKNPTESEMKNFKDGDRGFIAKDKKGQLCLFMTTNSGYLFHMKIWDRMVTAGFVSGSYFDQLRNGNIVSLQKMDGKIYLSENYEIEKIKPNIAYINEIISKFPYIPLVKKIVS